MLRQGDVLLIMWNLRVDKFGYITPTYLRFVRPCIVVQLLYQFQPDTQFLHKLYKINPLNPELNPICYLLALLGAHHILHVSRIRVKEVLTFK